MSLVGGLLIRALVLGLALSCGLGGCVQQAVLENDVRSAEWRARTLATASDLRLAEAALAAQLVELEALYQRDPHGARVQQLLGVGYDLWARGFVEARRLEALAAGDAAKAERERALQVDAEQRARYYRGTSTPTETSAALRISSALALAEAACRNRDRARYEKSLGEQLARAEASPEARLQHALTQQLAALWLLPPVAARCHFDGQ